MWPKSVTVCVSDLILPTENVVLLLWCFGKLPPNVGTPLAVRAPHQEEALQLFAHQLMSWLKVQATQYPMSSSLYWSLAQVSPLL